MSQRNAVHRVKQWECDVSVGIPYVPENANDRQTLKIPLPFRGMSGNLLAGLR